MFENIIRNAKPIDNILAKLFDKLAEQFEQLVTLHPIRRNIIQMMMKELTVD